MVSEETGLLDSFHFIERPISAVFLGLTLVWLAMVPYFMRRKLPLAVLSKADQDV
ncbi:MAG: hypothetical protein V1689_13200 [Pseudomonadota bacterium]